MGVDRDWVERDAGMPRALIAHPSPDLYGSDLQLLETITGLRAAGWSVTLALPCDGPLRAKADAEVVVRPFPVLRKSELAPLRLLLLVLRTPVEVFRMVRLIRARRPDVVLVNTMTVPWWIVAARLSRRPVLVHVHEAEEDVPRPVRVGLNAPLLLASEVIANSGSSARAVTAALPPVARRIRVIHNGVPDSGAATAAATPGRIALVGRLSPRKGIDVALEAVAELRRAGRGVSIEICGTAYAGYEWYENDLRARAARPDLAGAVTFSGYVNPTAPVLAAAAVVLVPSRVEPFGNTAVEALLSGRPVVVSDVQGLAEIVTDGRTGLLVPPGEAGPLAAAIARLLDDPELAARLGRDGRREALDRFTVERYRSDIAEVFAGRVDKVGRRRRPGR
jgi:glycosyltransferase involved in cell wall biosynthesis